MTNTPGAKEDKPEGWESLSEEEESGGSLSPNPELEEALREAAEAVDAATEKTRGKTESAAEPESQPGTRINPSPEPEPKPAQAPGEREGVPLGEAIESALSSGDVETLQAALASSHERFLRLSADFENFRRRSLKERQEAHRYGPENLVKDLLSTVDNLERAIEHARKGGDSGGGDLESLLQGVELVQREFLTILENHHVVEVEAAGKPFDPTVHEAMAQVPDAKAAPNTVIEVMQKGFQLRDRLLRPARVIVAKAPEEDEQGAGGAA